jgi:hypothetical protein
MVESVGLEGLFETWPIYNLHHKSHDCQNSDLVINETMKEEIKICILLATKMYGKEKLLGSQDIGPIPET